jgi:hypothetical protein
MVFLHWFRPDAEPPTVYRTAEPEYSIVVMEYRYGYMTAVEAELLDEIQTKV